MTNKTKAKIRQWIKEYERTQPGNVQIDEDDFSGSAYYLLTAVLNEEVSK